MKNALLIVTALLISNSGLLGQDGSSYTIDFTDPKSVVNGVFYAADSRDFHVLSGLCDPLKKGDNDTKYICALAEVIEQEYAAGIMEEVKKGINNFIDTFEKGKITGEVVYKTSKDGSKIAEVPIWLNHDIPSRSNEVMILVNRYGNWYLASL